MTDCLTDAPCEAPSSARYAELPAAQFQQGARRDGDSNKSKDVDFLDFGNIYRASGLITADNSAPGNPAADTTTAPQSNADTAAVEADVRKVLDTHSTAPADVVERLAAEAAAAAGAAAGAGAADIDGSKDKTASSGPAVCTDLSDEQDCPWVFPPSHRPPIGWPQLPPEPEGPVAAPKFPPGTPPPYPVFRPTIIEPPVRTPSNVFRPTPVTPVEPGPVGRPRENY